MTIVIDILYILFAISFYFLCYLLWNKYISKNQVDFSDISCLVSYFKKFIIKICKLFWIVIMLVWSFGLYQNTINPVEMPQYTITNGSKTVVFQTMAHIASSQFYLNVQNEIRSHKENGYVLDFEGVKPATKDIDQEKFNSLLGVKFSKDTYKNLKELYGLDNQDNTKFLNIVNNKDYDTDVSFDDLIVQYEKEHGIIDPKTSSDPIDIGSTIDSFRENYWFFLPLIQWYNKAIINFTVKHSSVRQFIIGMINKKDFFDLAINYRSQYLADYINNSKDQKIFITYGMEHFESFFEDLKAKDPNWKIVDEKWLQLIY